VFCSGVCDDEIGSEGEAGDGEFEWEGHEEWGRVVDLERSEEGELEVGRVRDVHVELERGD
jgi:hypothetical protein